MALPSVCMDLSTAKNSQLEIFLFERPSYGRVGILYRGILKGFFASLPLAKKIQRQDSYQDQIPDMFSQITQHIREFTVNICRVQCILNIHPFKLQDRFAKSARFEFSTLQKLTIYIGDLSMHPVWWLSDVIAHN